MEFEQIPTRLGSFLKKIREIIFTWNRFHEVSTLCWMKAVLLAQHNGKSKCYWTIFWDYSKDQLKHARNLHHVLVWYSVPNLNRPVVSHQTVWKFRYFSAIQILREINLAILGLKNCHTHLTFLATLNFLILGIFNTFKCGIFS